MRVLFINEILGQGSHGKICARAALKYIENSDEAVVAYGRGSVPAEYQHIAKRIGGRLSLYSHVLLSRVFDNSGFCSKYATKQFLRWADGYNPQLLCLHNIHGYFINVEMLFRWIKKRPQMRVEWTLHDEWAFTGHCGCFNEAGCEKWQRHCEKCPQKKEYPKSLVFDNSYKNYERKKKAFTGVQNMSLVAPSQWLADLAGKSFLGGYPVKVVYNTIDTSVFKPTESSFRENNGLNGKKVVLGVANVWQNCKGIRDMLLIAEMLDEGYAVVMVGLNASQIEKLSDAAFREKLVREAAFEKPREVYHEVKRSDSGTVIPPSPYNMYQAITGRAYENRPEKHSALLLLERTDSAEQLAQIYTAADVFVNPTREDNYPTVNLEAQACGTFVITYDTGGAKETIG